MEMKQQGVEPNVINDGAFMVISVCEKGTQPEKALLLLGEMMRRGPRARRDHLQRSHGH